MTLREEFDKWWSALLEEGLALPEGRELALYAWVASTATLRAENERLGSELEVLKAHLETVHKCDCPPPF